MTLPSLHDLERLRRRIVDLIQAEQYLDALEDHLSVDDLDVVGLTDRPDRPPAFLRQADGATHIGTPYEPDKDLAQILDVFDDAIERSSTLR